MFRLAEQMAPTSQTENVRALARGLLILEILAAAPQGLPLSEIANHANLSKSSTHRLLRTLMHCGYVLQNSNETYFASLKLLTLSSQLTQQASLGAIARPHLEYLAQTTGETAHLVLLDRDTAIYIEKVESPNPIRMYSQIGRRAPLHCTGVGKAILAFLSPERLEAILANYKLTRHTPNTITDPHELRRHLAEIRERGYAIDDNEHEENVCCIAAPLFARNGQVVGAVSISAVSYRVNLDTLHSWWPLLREEVKQLNVELQHLLDRYA